MSHSDRTPDQGKVIQLASFKEKKVLKESLSEGTPLYVSHLDGTIKGSPHFKRPQAEDFGDRIQRIRQSLEKINSLMTELKKRTQKSLD